MEKLLLILLLIATIGVGAVAQAQQTEKVPRIGFLDNSTASGIAVLLEAFRQELSKLGWIEGKNITIEYRFAEQKLERLPELAADLVHFKVDLIVVTGGPAGLVAKKATTTIPIVITSSVDPVGEGLIASLAQDPDPVASGFVASLARPGGNITGLANLSPELSGKRLELLKEIIPRLSRVAVLGTSSQPGNAQSLKEMERAAGAVGVKLQYLDVLDPKDIEMAFGTASKGRADAVLVLTSVVTNSQKKQIVELAVKNRLPPIYYTAEWVEAGGLMIYGASFTDLFQRAATYVDRILKGAKAAELPVEQPKKFDFIINLKAAKQIGLTIPQRVLARADRVIK